MDDASGPDVDNEVHGDLLTHVGGVTAATPAGSPTRRSATYNGTSGYSDFVADPENPTATVIGTGGNQSIGVWFKTTTASGVLAGYNSYRPVGGHDQRGVPAAALHRHRRKAARSVLERRPRHPSPRNGTVTDGKWHHAVLSAGASSQALYLDGAPVGSKAGTVTLPAATANAHTQVGGGFLSSTWPASGRTTAVASFFKGSLSDVATYNAELSADQVSTQWAAAAQSDGKAAVTTATLIDPAQKTAVLHLRPATWAPARWPRSTRSGNQTQYGYDTGGFLHTVTDPNGDVTTTGHDVRGNDVSTKTCQDFSADKCSTVYYTLLPRRHHGQPARPTRATT